MQQEQVSSDIQDKFFQIIKNKIPSNISLVNSLADLLNVSTDSAYRRIRGQKELSFDEIKTLCLHFGISLDALFFDTPDIVPFHYKPFNKEINSFEQYLESVAIILESTFQYKDKKIYFEGKDIPLANLVYFPEVISFKSFFWSKVVYSQPGFENKTFDISEVESRLVNLGNKILNLLQVIPTIEVWNEDTINSTIRQIEFCHEAGYFRNNNVPHTLLEKLSDWLVHFQMQATVGKRFKPEQQVSGIDDNFQLFYTETLIPNNNILIKKDDALSVYLSQNDLTILVTRHSEFCKDQKEWLENLIRKSTAITISSEKERNKFFLKVHSKIDQMKNKLQ